MPRYEFSEGTSNKFWEIRLAGTSFTTTYGKIGTTGQTTLKEFTSAAEAKQAYDKLIAEKTKQGGKGAQPAAKAAPVATTSSATAASSAAASASGTPGARYFEFVEGTSSKFWEIKLDGESVTTRYGKLGTEGQTTEKEFDGRAEAFREYGRLVAEKTRKGYVEKGGGGATDKRHPEFEKAIVADPHDASAYVVYADWLQEQSDPRGELMSLHLAAETRRDARAAKAAAALIASKADYFLGPLAEHTRTYDGNDTDAFTWRFGFIHAAKLSHNQYSDSEFEGSLAEVLELLLRHPSGRFLTELVFGFNNDPNEDPLDDLIGILAKRAPPTIRKLHFGDFVYPDETEMSWYHVGNLGKVWKAVPQLRSLIVQGGEFELGTIELPELTHAEFRTGGLSAASARAIARAKWPRIEHLEVWYGDDNYGGDAKVADAMALIDRTDLVRLTSLGIKNTQFTDELCGDERAQPQRGDGAEGDARRQRDFALEPRLSAQAHRRLLPGGHDRRGRAAARRAQGRVPAPRGARRLAQLPDQGGPRRAQGDREVGGERQAARGRRSRVPAPVRRRVMGRASAREAA